MNNLNVIMCISTTSYVVPSFVFFFYGGKAKCKFHRKIKPLYGYVLKCLWLTTSGFFEHSLKLHCIDCTFCTMRFVLIRSGLSQLVTNN